MTFNDKANERRGAERPPTGREDIARQEIEVLLPWHAAGTLRRRDRNRVEEALRKDPELVRHAALVREELAETIRLNERLGAPSARAYDKLMATIDGEAAGRRGIASPLFVARWIAGGIASLSPRTLAIAASVAALAIALQGFVLLGMLTKPEGTYQGLAAGEGVHKRGTFALVRFVHQASAGEITKFLETYQATLVDGPGSGGVFRVKVAMTTLAKEELARIVSRMQGEHVIEFAAPSE